MTTQPIVLSVLGMKRSIFSDDTILYRIPLYQRSFAWDDTEIEQLINDINDIEDETYYIGTLIVSKTETENVYEVIDGQQRLTALFLLLSSLGESPNNALIFQCREKSNFTLKNLNVSSESLANDKIDENIKEKKKYIDSVLCRPHITDLASKLKRVKLYRIEVPEHTDLNHYFEIMNTRGEQLEQHDILKATLMGYLAREEHKLYFEKIWEAVSDMSGYVQMNIQPPAFRATLFGDKWNAAPEIRYEKGCLSTTMSEKSFTINEIIHDSFIIDKTDGVTDKDERVRFESIISFPYFLLHVLKVFIDREEIRHENSIEIVPELLDDKKLCDAFDKVLKYGIRKNKKLTGDRGTFALDFIEYLLKCRFLFDKYIIKREYINEDSDGDWSLKQLEVSGSQKNKKPYYKNTLFSTHGEHQTTSDKRNKNNLMLQSCLRVSYTSPKVMHWITILLKWLYKDHNASSHIDEYGQEIEQIVKRAVYVGYFSKTENEPSNFGVNTPHLVFNYLDYLLWKDNPQKHASFVFEFRNSVEHWYPQNPSKDTFDSFSHGDGLNSFGNLCLIQRATNAKFSNMAIHAKATTFEKMIAKGSLKLQEMAKQTLALPAETANQEWKDRICQEHEEEMLGKLRTALEK